MVCGLFNNTSVLEAVVLQILSTIKKSYSSTITFFVSVAGWVDLYSTCTQLCPELLSSILSEPHVLIKTSRSLIIHLCPL